MPNGVVVGWKMSDLALVVLPITERLVEPRRHKQTVVLIVLTDPEAGVTIRRLYTTQGLVVSQEGALDERVDVVGTSTRCGPVWPAAWSDACEARCCRSCPRGQTHVFPSR
jgi:hypothetical protein